MWRLLERIGLLTALPYTKTKSARPDGLPLIRSQYTRIANHGQTKTMIDGIRTQVPGTLRRSRG
jgi:hypothetical protein